MTEVDIHNVDITFKDLNYMVCNGNQNVKERVILNKVSGVLKSSEITAILGPSGGGKTSLLNLLAAKIQSKTNKVTIEGQIRANGYAFTNDQFNQFSAFVMQNDILLEFLTVREAIKFSANMKVKGTQLEREIKVNEVIEALKLQHCQNTLIGGVSLKGISGGERKRVNIACEVINDPQVLFLDEPTSGLDSFTAYIVISLLKDYALQKSMNVIMSVHSPNNDLWGLFDNIILISQGKFVYQGKQNKIKSYFDDLGFKCPINMCPADYYMSLISFNESEIQSNENEFIIQRLYKAYNQSISKEIDQKINEVQIYREIHLEQVKRSFFYQIMKIAQRNLIKITRDPLLLRSRILQTVTLSTLFGLIYYNQPPIDSNISIRNINDRNGIMFMDIMNNFMNSTMGVIVSFPSERAVYLKEENSKLYTPITYFIGKFLTEFFMNLFLPLIYGSIVYFMVGYSHEDSSQFWIYIVTLMLLSFCGSALGLTIGIMFSDVRTSTAITPAFIIPQILFCGMFKQRTDYAQWIGWIQYISPFTYAFETLIRKEYKYLESEYNPIQTFDYSLGIDNCLVIMLFIYIILQSISVIMLYLKRRIIQ